MGDCEDLINHFVIISHRDWTPDFGQFVSSRRVTRARHASNCRILLDHLRPLIWPYDDQKLEFYLDEIRTKNLKFEQQYMSSLGIFQNGNGSIFWNFFNSWRSFVAEEMTSYLVVTSHVTRNDPFSTAELNISWLREWIYKWGSGSEIFAQKYLSKFFKKIFIYRNKNCNLPVPSGITTTIITWQYCHVTQVTCWG